jgi:hypothetical protein
MQMTFVKIVALPLAAALGFALGCGQNENKGGHAKEKPAQVAATNNPKKVHDHSEWWCDEHGIPEAECSMCSPKVAAECKKKGDWCDKHDRAKSQCFLCDPKLKEKYAARYRTKYGKEPPPFEEEQ